MKKLLAVLLAILMMTGCSGGEKVNISFDDSVNLSTVCLNISGKITGSENGWYEIMRHSDGTADIVYTDISTATRKVPDNFSAIDTPYGSLGGVFTTDGYVYYYHYGFPLTMGRQNNKSAIYQYDTHTNLIQTVFFDENIKFSINSAVVSDGKKLYFVQNSQDKSTIYAVDQDSLKAEVIYETPQKITLKGGYKNLLIVFAADDTAKYMQAVDVTSGQAQVLFESSFPWYVHSDGTLYNYQDTAGTLKTYSLESGKSKQTTLFKEDKITSVKFGFPAVKDRYLFVRTGERCFIYDLLTEKLTEVQRYLSDAVCAGSDDNVVCIMAQSEERILLNNSLTVRMDYNYITIPFKDYLAGADSKTAVNNQIKYR